MKPFSKTSLTAQFFNLLLAIFILFNFCGCANYKYAYGIKPYSDGYVVLRNDTLIPEYTIGRNNKAAPELNLARERFKRRRAKVEYYYKKMDLLYNPFTSFISYPFSLAGMVVGIFKLPFIIVSDYRYEHNPEYKKKIDEALARKKKKEDERRQRWQEELRRFIERQLAIEEALGSNINTEKK